MTSPPYLAPLLKRPGLLVGLGALALVLAFTPADWRWTTRAIVAWDVGVAIYLAFAFAAMRVPSAGKDITQRAAELDQGRSVVLVGSLAGAMASIASVIAEVVQQAGSHDNIGLRLALVGTTVALSWLFIHVVFALHYAHDFYTRDGRKRRGGLMFPGDDPDPDYWDFLHFALVIGVANQTADIQISSPAVRRLVTLHGIVAFLFNTVIVALTINATASLFS